jgi:glycerol uptake facilitator-like aquaporin
MKNKSNEILNFAFGLITGAFIAGWLVFLIMGNKQTETKNQIERNTNHEIHRSNPKPILPKDNAALAYSSISI